MIIRCLNIAFDNSRIDVNHVTPATWLREELRYPSDSKKVDENNIDFFVGGGEVSVHFIKGKILLTFEGKNNTNTAMITVERIGI